MPKNNDTTVDVGADTAAETTEADSTTDEPEAEAGTAEEPGAEADTAEEPAVVQVEAQDQ